MAQRSKHERDRILVEHGLPFVIYQLFTIDYNASIKNKAMIAKEWHISWSEIDHMPYSDYEELVKIINDDVKRQEKEQKEHEKQQRSSMPNMNQMMANTQRSMPSISMPKINVPHI